MKELTSASVPYNFSSSTAWSFTDTDVNLAVVSRQRSSVGLRERPALNMTHALGSADAAALKSCVAGEKLRGATILNVSARACSIADALPPDDSRTYGTASGQN
jgi:hypothetical protein